MPVRRFSRFHPGADDPLRYRSALPNDGMCLSAFLVIRPTGRPGEALLGRIDPAADWATIGGLDPERIASIGPRWMLPSSQLLLFESPVGAAERIAVEQLGAPLPEAPEPRVFSEAYDRPGSPGDPHWDLHFVFESTWPTATPPPGPPFAELAFVRVDRLAPREVARGGADILALAGLPAAAGSPLSGPERTRRP